MIQKIFKTLFLFFLIVLILIVSVIGLIKWYEPEIISFFIQQVNSQIATPISVKKIKLDYVHDFPHISIDFQEVDIQSTGMSSTPFLHAQHVYVSFNVWDIFDKKYETKTLLIEKGHVHIQFYEDGSHNFAILKRDTSSRSNQQKAPSKFSLNKVVLNEVHVTIHDERFKNQYDLFAQKAALDAELHTKGWKARIDGIFTSNSIAIGKYRFLKDKKFAFEGGIDFRNHTSIYHFLPTKIHVSGGDYILAGYYQSSHPGFLDVNIKEDKSNIQNLISLLPQQYTQTLENYQSKGDIYFRAKIKGPLSSENPPGISVKFGCDKASFKDETRNMTISNAHFKGYYANKEANDGESVFRLTELKALINGKPMEGHLIVNRLEDPYLDLEAQTNIDMATLFRLGHVAFDKAEGDMQHAIKLKGKLSDLKAGKYHNIFFEGHHQFEDVSFHLSQKLQWNHCQGSLDYRNKDLTIERLNGEFQNSAFEFTGRFTNILAYWFQDKLHSSLDLKFKTKQLDVDALLESSKDSIKSSAYPLMGFLPFTCVFEIEKLHYQQKTFTPFLGVLRHTDKYLAITDLKLQSGRLKLIGKGEVNYKSNHIYQHSIDFQIEKAPVDTVFMFFKNFGQDAIQSHQIKGLMDAKGTVLFDYDMTKGLDSKSLVAQIDVKLVEGSLKDIPSFQKMSKFIHETALAEVKFSELNNHFYVANETIVIPEMKIKTSITTMTLSGTHQFNNQIDYKVKLPLKNYRKKENLQDIDAIENDGEGGLNLYLSIKGNASNPIIAFDSRAVKEHVKEKLKEEVEEFKNLFKNGAPKPSSPSPKAPQPQTDEYFDF